MPYLLKASAFPLSDYLALFTLLQAGISREGIANPVVQTAEKPKHRLHACEHSHRPSIQKRCFRYRGHHRIRHEILASNRFGSVEACWAHIPEVKWSEQESRPKKKAWAWLQSASLVSSRMLLERKTSVPWGYCGNASNKARVSQKDNDDTRVDIEGSTRPYSRIPTKYGCPQTRICNRYVF